MVKLAVLFPFKFLEWLILQPKRFAFLLPGMLLSAVIAIAAMALGKLPSLQAHGMSALTIAIILGILVGNLFYHHIETSCAEGVGFAKQNLLRLGIILYGLRLTFQDISRVGLNGVFIDALMLISTFGLALLIGIKLFKLERNIVILIGAGSSICGAAAVMATEPVIKAKSEQVVVAVSTVVVFGTLAIFIYPVLYRLDLGALFGHSSERFGIYAGSTIHEVAQVVAAGRSINEDIANIAVIAKMVRVMMLAPFLMLLSGFIKAFASNQKQANTVEGTRTEPISIPWFAFVFILVVGLNSVVRLPQWLVAELQDIDTILLAMAMAALGLTTHVSAIRRAGFNPLILAAILFAWLIVGGALLNHLVG